MPDRHVRDRGQAVVLVVAVVVLTVLCAVAVAQFGRRVVGREQAQTAADAAALAGVSGGRPAAARVAAANGGTLVSFTVLDAATSLVEVRVVVATEVAVARAARAP